nr:cupin domain-containing protein [uncultured Acetatifactor sp.]
MYEKYLIKMNDPKDWIRHWDEGTQVVNDFILPRGPHEKDEMSDTIYHKDATVPYHQHRKGYETFEIAAGSVECFMRGKRFIATAGDIIHIAPWTPHGFRFLEEGTIWRELFQEIDMSGGIWEKNTVNQNFPQMKENPEFMRIYRGDPLNLTRETPVCEDVDKRKMHEVRTPDFAYSTYSGDGYEIRLKVGKWETNGVKEIWHASLKKGFVVEFAFPHCNWELYYVKEGALEVEVMGEKFVAGPDCLVHIPNFHPHTIRALEDTKLYDYGGETDLMAMMEDLDSLKKHHPEKLREEAFMTAFRHKYKCFVTGCRMEQ